MTETTPNPRVCNSNTTAQELEALIDHRVMVNHSNLHAEGRLIKSRSHLNRYGVFVLEGINNIGIWFTAEQVESIKPAQLSSHLSRITLCNLQ